MKPNKSEKKLSLYKNHWYVFGILYMLFSLYVMIGILYNLGQAPWIKDNIWNNMVGVFYYITIWLAGIGVFYKNGKEYEKKWVGKE